MYSTSACFWNLSSAGDAYKNTSSAIFVKIDEVINGDAYVISNASFNATGQLSWGVKALYESEIVKI